MLIIAGIFTSLILCAVIDVYMESKKKQELEQSWMQHNRMVAETQARSRNGLGTWINK
jgi:hypothetical protein